MSKCFILANGTPPDKSIIGYLQENGYNTFYAADGGANSAYKLKLVPDYVIGDLDSADVEILDFYRNHNVEVIKLERQNDTDVEKCLKHASENGFKEAVLLGATGDRLDHSFCNMGISLKFFNKILVKILHEKSLLTPYSGIIELNTVPGETISIYGIDKNTLFTTEGLKYPLNKEALPFGIRESTSNASIGNKIKINIENGVAFIIREFETLRNNGLFHSA